MAEMIRPSAVFEEALRRELFLSESILFDVKVAECGSVIGTQKWGAARGRGLKKKKKDWRGKKKPR